MNLIIFLLIVYGLSNIIVNESIFLKPVLKIRNINGFFDKLFSCTTCLSFYLGALLYILVNIDISGIYLIDMILSGIMSSGFVNLIEHIKIRIGYE